MVKLPCRRHLLYFMVVIVVVVLLVVIIRTIRKKERYEEQPLVPPAWFDTLTEKFFSSLQRPVDVVNQRYYRYITKNLPLSKASMTIDEDFKKYTSEVEKGKELARGSKIIVTGLLQNCFRQIPQLMERCMRIVSMFKDYRIVILENNSSDDSRKYLLEWAEKNKKVTILCNDAYAINTAECDIFSAKSSNDHSPMPDRIQRMAYLRNIYMDHVSHYYKDFDYMCVMDMDLDGELMIDGFFHSLWVMEKKKASGVAGNGVILRDNGDFYYYDSFAHVEVDEPHIMTDIASKSEHDNYVHINMTHLYTTQMTPDRVRSAFGGIAIYDLKRIINHRYSYSSTFLSCEHAFFHDNMVLYVDPRFIFVIDKNG